MVKRQLLVKSYNYIYFANTKLRLGREDKKHRKNTQPLHHYKHKQLKILYFVTSCDTRTENCFFFYS